MRQGTDPISFLGGRVMLHCGDCLEVLAAMPENSVDAVVTDPPYHLTSIVKRFGSEDAAAPKEYKTGAYGGGFDPKGTGTGVAFARMSRGFMGKAWDGGDIAFRPETWAAVMRVLKPGGHMVAFAATKNAHRMVSAIEDAGFEIRDTIAWLYGSGFPKSLDVSKAIDKAAGAEREVVGYATGGGFKKNSIGAVRHHDDIPSITAAATEAAKRWEGWGTALKPAFEPICLARKPLGTGNIYVLKNVECGIREAGYTGDIVWKGLENAESAESSKRKRDSSRIQSSEEISAETAGASQTENINSEDLTSLKDVMSGGTQKTKTNTSPAREPTSEGCASECSTTTDGNASVAEKLSPPFLPSTMSTVEEPLTDDQSATISTEILSETVSPPTIESFAGIATGLSDSLAHVLIKREGSSFVWPKDLPRFVPSKPLNVAANVLRWGTGALAIDATRIGVLGGTAKHASNLKCSTDSVGGFLNAKAGDPIDAGRWPANVAHDGSDEVVAAFPETGLSSGGGMKDLRKGALFLGETNPNITDSCGFGDSGSAARFFASFPQRNEARCCLCGCLLCDDHGIVPLCNASNAASNSSTQNIPNGGSALFDVAASQPLGSADKPSLLNGHAINAESDSEAIPLPSDNSARPDALSLPLSKIVQSALSAADLCVSCATDIARALVAVRQARSAESVQFQDFISGRNAPILIRHLALYVQGRESTDIILTTPSLKQLFGSVFHAIENYTPRTEEKPRELSERSRRLWYSSKADSNDRLGSKHPTVKPVDLMRWLVRMVTPPGGTILDPFAGSGSTGEAAFREGFSARLIEREAEYQADIRRRMALVLEPPRVRKQTVVERRGKTDAAGPLFDRVAAE